MTCIIISNERLHFSKVLIIAEAGVNHNGDINKAFELIDAAKYAGADVVKFQSFVADNIVTKSAEKAAYQKKQLQNEADDQYNMLKRLELTFDEQKKLFAYGKSAGIRVASTPFDSDSIDFLSSLDMSRK